MTHVIELKGHFFTDFRKANPGYAPQTFACAEKTVSRLLETETSSERPGMLLGKVQSGKTRTFVSILALAFDNGFDVAVVLSKNSRALIQQTTKRLNSDFKMFVDESEMQIFDIMSAPETFSGYELEQKLVFVAKKQTDNLDRLSELITKPASALANKRVLFIDDEADAASIGYEHKKGEGIQARSVSLRISKLRKGAANSSYLQVTATPYSLYLQPEDVEVINAASFSPTRPAFTELVYVPDSYVGGDTYFGEASRAPELTVEKLIHHVVDPNELTCLKKLDGRRLNIKFVLTEKSISSFRHAIINSLVGTCIQRINGVANGGNERKLLYSFLLHTEAARGSHRFQAVLTEEIIEAMKEAGANATKSAQFEKLVQASYDDLATSLKLAGHVTPPFPDVAEAVRKLLAQDHVTITTVNSDTDVMKHLDESGQLKLRSPLNIFIGGQAIDRGVTVANLIGFYYGRSPNTHQQDTVLQHSRMYGYRRDDLPVTRFYTSANIRTVMQNIEDFDSTLRAAVELGKGKWDVQFVRTGDACSQIVPCSPNKILISDVKGVGPRSRMAPFGFQTLKKSSPIAKGDTMADRIQAIDAEVSRLVGFGSTTPATITVEEAVALLDLIEPTLSFEDFDVMPFNWNQAKSILHHLAVQSSDKKNHQKVLLWAAKDRNVGRLAAETTHAEYIATPDSKTEMDLKRKFAIEMPILFLLRQEGTVEKGWQGTPFYWPVIRAQEMAPYAVFAGEELDD